MLLDNKYCLSAKVGQPIAGPQVLLDCVVGQRIAGQQLLLECEVVGQLVARQQVLLPILCGWTTNVARQKNKCC